MTRALSILCLILLLVSSASGQLIQRIIFDETCVDSMEDFSIYSSSIINYDYYDVSFLVSPSSRVKDSIIVNTGSKDSVFKIAFIYSAPYSNLLFVSTNKLTAKIKQEADTFYVQLYDPNNNILLTGQSSTFFPFNWMGMLTTYYSNGRKKEQYFFCDSSIVDRKMWAQKGLLLDSVFLLKKLDSIPRLKGTDKLYSSEFMKYLQSEINYPAEARRLGLMGTVFVKYIISKEGEVVFAEVLRGVHPLLDNECIKVIINFPTLCPGVYKGRKVNTMVIYPFRFWAD